MEALLIAGRILFALIFVGSGVGHFVKPGDTGAYAKSRGVPVPDWLVGVSGGLIAAGGLGVIMGVWIDLAALGLTVYLLVTAVLVHRFWSDEEPVRTMEMALFMKNLAMAGAGLVIFALAATGGDLGWELGSRAFRL